MPRLTWSAIGEHFYEIGIDRGVLYIDNKPGVVWNGLISVSEASSGGESKSFYIDGIKFLNLSSSEDFNATIEAYTYPREFEPCQGNVSSYRGLYATNQKRKTFGLSYRTKIGNDIDGFDHGYKIHLIYNALAEPAQRQYSSINASTDPSTFSWNISTLPPSILDYKPTAHFVIDSRYAEPLALSAIEDVLYGTNIEEARLPTTEELFSIFNANSDFEVVDHGDGTFTVSGSDDYISTINSTTFEINHPGAVYIDEDSYTLTST